MTSPTTLFDLSDLEKRKTANQQDFENQNLDLLTAFAGMVNRSFERLNSEILSTVELTSRNKHLKAIAVNGFLMGELIQSFPEYCRAATKVRFNLKTPTGEWIYVKKLFEDKNKKRRPKNASTKNNTKIYHQLSDSETDTCSNVFLGYTALDDMTAATGYYAVCIDGETELWVSDLKTLAKKAQIKQVPREKAEPTLSPNVVKIKKDRTG